MSSHDVGELLVWWIYMFWDMSEMSGGLVWLLKDC